MKVIHVDNVDQALATGMDYLMRYGDRETSRNGMVLVAPCPVTTVYQQPRNRVLFNPVRDANPFFHLFESIWMLAGRNDVEFPARFAKQLAEYTDDGSTIPGAYGHRWRQHFGYDQLPIIINELTTNPSSRRCVLAMWDGAAAPELVSAGDSDLHRAVSGGKDVPCNTHAYFRVRDNALLDMTVCNRSNDIVWGAYGANAVHFSILQEFVALACGLQVGKYFQISNNYHLYIDRPDVDRLCKARDYGIGDDLGRRLQDYSNLPLLAAGENWDKWLVDAEVFCSLHQEPFTDTDFHCTWFTQVAVPMMEAINLHKAGKTADALAALWDSRELWHVAGYEWLQRRHAAKLAKGLA